MIEALLFTLLLTGVLGAGLKLLSLAGFSGMPLLEKIIFSAILGYAALYLILFALASLGLLYSVSIALTVSLIIAVSFAELKSLAIALKRRLQRRAFPAKMSFNITFVLSAVLLFFVAVNFFASFAPVAEWDSLAYHLAIPKIYMQNHGFVYIPYMLQANWPLSADLLYTSALGLGSEIIAALIAYSLGLVLIAGIYSFARKQLGETYALLAALVFYSMPLVSTFAATPKVDIPWAAAVFMGFYAFAEWTRNHERKWLVLSAVISGFSASIKLNGLVIPAVLAFFVLYDSLASRRGLATALAESAGFGAVAFAIVLPWYAKSFIHTGNPIWPFFSSVFGGENLTPLFLERLSYLGHNYGLGTSLLAFVSLPFTTLSHSPAFGILAGLSPLPLMLVPLLFFFRKTQRAIIYSLILSLIFTVSWFFTSQQLRFLVGITPLLSVAAAHAVHALVTRNFFPKTAYLLILAVFGFSALYLAGLSTDKVPVILGLEPKLSYLDGLKDWNNYRAFQFVNKNLGSDAKLLLFRETRGYYSDREYVWADPSQQAYLDFSLYESDMLPRLKELGITHIFINTNIHSGAYDARSLQLMQTVLQNHSMNLYSENGIEIYEIIYP